MHKQFLFGFLLLLLFTATGLCQQDTLTLNKCIDIALNNNPQIKLAEGNYDFAASNVTLARSVLFPQVFISGWICEKRRNNIYRPNISYSLL